jgi:Acyl-CoA hydrolase
MHYVATKICRASEIGLNGNLFGGTLLSWLDEAGAAFAGYLCRAPNMVTLKMEEVLFRRPVQDQSPCAHLRPGIQGRQPPR